MRKGNANGPRSPAGVIAGFFVFVMLVAIGLFFFFEALARHATFVKVNEFPAFACKPGRKACAEIARQQTDLERFRWIDKSRGVFQIPIARAMKMVSDRGQKAYDPVLVARVDELVVFF